jgi:hypothetical protein
VTAKAKCFCNSDSAACRRTYLAPKPGSRALNRRATCILWLPLRLITSWLSGAPCSVFSIVCSGSACMHVHVCVRVCIPVCVCVSRGDLDLSVCIKEGGGGKSGSFSVFPYLCISKCTSAPSYEHMHTRTQHRAHLFGYHGSEFLDLLVQLL